MIRGLRNRLMAGIELIKTFLQQASARGSRSTALYPLGWALGLVLASLIVAIWEHAVMWVIVLLSVCSSVLLVAYIIAYFFFMVKNPDALRSEQFSLSKMQIEKSQIGDTSHGFQEIEATANVRANLPEPNGENED